jgi:hypothetical protein
VFGAAACGDSPTAPGGGNTMTITSVTPDSPVASGAAQTLTVPGGTFVTGLAMFVKEPDGTERVLSGAAIQNLQASSFQVAAVLPQSGAYELRVGASAAAPSSPFQLIVRSTQTAPVIFNVTPSSVVRGPGLQPLRFTGLDFDPNLTMTRTDPDGVVTLLTGPQLSTVTATSVEVSQVFTKPGVHTFVITNSSGESSNPMQVNAL